MNTSIIPSVTSLLKKFVYFLSEICGEFGRTVNINPCIPCFNTPLLMLISMLYIYQDHPRNLIPELCRQFYDLQWVTGTGGGMSIKQG